MALKDLLALVDDKLSEIFERKEYDGSKDRERFLKRIETTKDKFLATEPARGQKDFSIANGVVRYQPTLRGSAISIDGRTVFHVPSERFDSFLDALKSSVEAGELDDAIKAAVSEDDLPEVGEKPVRKPRTSKPAGDGGRGWSEERRAAFNASIEARRAAKDAAKS